MIQARSATCSQILATNGSASIANVLDYEGAGASAHYLSKRTALFTYTTASAMRSSETFRSFDLATVKRIP
jgi:hypothetical protein